MRTELVSLSSVFPCWKGSLIPSAFEALQRGLERERERLRSKPFVVMATRYEFDYDGFAEYIDLLDGFTAEDGAVEYARHSVEVARRNTLAEPSYGGYRWQVVEGEWSPLFVDRQDCEHIRRVFRTQLKMVTGSGYDSRYFEFDVLHISAAEIIGPELFAYIGAEIEVTWYLIKLGEACR